MERSQQNETGTTRPAHGRDSSNLQPDDELDDLFNYEVNPGDVFRELDTNMDPVGVTKKGQPAGKGGKAKRGTDALGIDEEVKVKKRRVNVKLDEEKLLSDPGIPKLRRTAKDRLRFKGKGHEFSDIGRLLAFYQLWLDDLHPKAKFADALSIVEKLGHSRRMQIMRKQWLEEADEKGTNSSAQPVASRPSQGPMPSRVSQRSEYPVEGRSSDGGRASRAITPKDRSLDDTVPLEARPQTPPTNLEDDDDLYSATPAAIRRHNATKETRSKVPDHTELDALMAEDVPVPATGKTLETAKSGAGPFADEDEDELDALLEEDASRIEHAKHTTAVDSATAATAANSTMPAEDDFDDDMEAMAEMELMR